ncbi:MAG: tRNA dihydrouridine(20/20a) synthase DusA [Succinivibrio sp.]|nr:tRNA dihydrouridine(20/20a) synthase DusA [Succinivibrio sp.]
MLLGEPFGVADLFSIAPMVDVTTSAFRRLARVMTRQAMLYTEMIAAEALVHEKLELLAHHEDELPCTLQLGGNDPKKLAVAAAIGESMGFSAINLNAGCPSDKVQSGQFGAVMMKDPQLLSECLYAMQEAVTIPVSVKTRLGVDEFASEDFTRELIANISFSGCRHVVLHARHCWLKGLSPKENRSVPPLDYRRVYRLKQEFTDLYFTINGGIISLESCFEHLNNVDGVMLGRAIIDNPYLLASVDSMLFDDPAPPPSREEVFARIEDLAEQFLSEGHQLQHLAIHALNLFNSCPGSRRYRRYLSEHMTRPGAGVEVLEQAYQFVKNT